MKKVKIETKKLGYFSEEAYKSLRTNLMFCGENKRVIALTSCTPGEGKSNISLNLSIALSRTEKRVLLIEADLRKPVLMGMLKVKEKIKGLTYYLSGQAVLQDVICDTDIPRLHIIFAGRIPPNPTELLGSERFAPMIRCLRNSYDYIIIDTPPLGSVIDCAVIAENCDGVMMVIETKSISYKLAQEVKGQLEKTKCPILGVILNKEEQNRRSYRSRYGKSAPYGRYEKPEEEKKTG